MEKISFLNAYTFPLGSKFIIHVMMTSGLCLQVTQLRRHNGVSVIGRGSDRSFNIQSRSVM